MSAGLPYLGSKISLISQSDVRYEGILYTIDTVANTVALARVRSFGTEDRPTDRPMAPREEEYEYIIFRATDLKDIRVLEPPNPQATLQGGLASDPAIVKHSKGGPVGSKLGYGAIGSQNSPENRSSGVSSGDLRRSPKDDSGGSKNRSRQNSQSSGRGHSGGRGAPSPGQAIGFHRGGRGGSRGSGIGVGGSQYRNNQSLRGQDEEDAARSVVNMTQGRDNSEALSSDLDTVIGDFESMVVTFKEAVTTRANQLRAGITRFENEVMKQKQLLGEFELKSAADLTELIKKMEEVKRGWAVVASPQTGSRSPQVPECPVCYERMIPPRQIYTCGNGHVICSDCKARMNEETGNNECINHCGARYTGRATTVEQMIGEIMGTE